MATDYLYYTSHALSSDVDRADYQVKLIARHGTGTNDGETFYCNGHCRSDFDDVAFEDANGDDLSYWRESYVSGDYAIFWVKVPSISLSTSIIIKYGNVDAISGSDPYATFLFFDDFTGITLDTSKWESGIGALTLEVNDSLIVTDASNGWITNNADTGSQLVCKWIPTANCKVVWKSKLHLDAAVEKGQLGVAFIDSSQKIIAANLHTDPDEDAIASGCYGCIDTSTYDYNDGANDESRAFALGKDGTTFVLKHQTYGSGIWTNDITATSSTAVSKLAIVAGKQSGVEYCRYVQIDWVYARAWFADEPAHGIWSPESKRYVEFTSLYQIKPEPSINLEQIQFYHSLTAEGGDIDTLHRQVSSVLNNEFTKITQAERQTGTIRYTKQFVRNENDMVWGPVKIYFESKTQMAPKTAVAFALTGTKSLLHSSATLSGDATVTATRYMLTSSDLREEIKPGELVYNSTDDGLDRAVKAIEVASTYIRTETTYIGTLGTLKRLSVAPATMATFIAPITSEDTTTPTQLLNPLEYFGVWKRYTVMDTCPPFSNDWFTILFEDT